ncbi:E3 ubiquitin-protein ligase RNF25 isoform X2 [Oratosquilla oratoria]
MPDEVTIDLNDSGVPCAVEVVVVPATGQKVDEQHVRVTLRVNLPPEYPDAPPAIELRNPRGIDDAVLQTIEVESAQKCDEYLGCPVIYELIELVRENLTANNTPSCPCAICLYHFTERDVFTKTPCYHYFHTFCLGRYVANCEEELAAEEEEPQPVWMTKERKVLGCPVCREPLGEEVSSIEMLATKPPQEGETCSSFIADDPNLKALQKKMAELYLYQKNKGGIIDIEEEKNKFLLSSEKAMENSTPEERKEVTTASFPVNSFHPEPSEHSSGPDASHPLVNVKPVNKQRTWENKGAQGQSGPPVNMTSQGRQGPRAKACPSDDVREIRSFGGRGGRGRGRGRGTNYNCNQINHDMGHYANGDDRDWYGGGRPYSSRDHMRQNNIPPHERSGLGRYGGDRYSKGWSYDNSYGYDKHDRSGRKGGPPSNRGPGGARGQRKGQSRTRGAHHGPPPPPGLAPLANQSRTQATS